MCAWKPTFIWIMSKQFVYMTTNLIFQFELSKTVSRVVKSLAFRHTEQSSAMCSAMSLIRFVVTSAVLKVSRSVLKKFVRSS